jgi:hypothetical protein
VDLFLAHDAETGGLSARLHSHLTHYFGVYTYENRRFVLRRDLDLKIKPNPYERYMVTPEAMAVNRIDLKKHDEVAITRDEAAMQTYYFLKEESNDGANKLIRMGYNEPFDNEFVICNILNEPIWKHFTEVKPPDVMGVNYRSLDGYAIAKILRSKGKIPRESKLKLTELARTLGIPFTDSEIHTAKGDTGLFVKTLEVMLTM